MAVDYSKYHSILDSYEPYQPPADQSAPTQNTSALADFGTDLKRGVQQVPSAITGLLDIPVAAVTGRPMVSEGWEGLGQITGFQPQKWADEARAEYSPERQAAQQQAAQAEGFVDTAGVYLSNPSMLAGTVLESVPSIALGGVYGRALRGVGALSGVTRGAIGEGAVMAGQSMNEMVEDGVDPRRAAAFATGVGVAGGALGVLGGSLTQRLGLVDVDTLAAGGARAAGVAAPGLLRRVAGGAVAEGAFEELPQTMVETVAGNLAAERQWDEDLGKNAAVGLLAGGLMGGVVNIPGARRQRDLTQDAPPQGGETASVEQSALQDAIKTDTVPVQNWINQQLRIGVSPAQTQKDAKAAFEGKIEPTLILDVNGAPKTTTSAFDVYEFQNDFDVRMAKQEALRRGEAPATGAQPAQQVDEDPAVTSLRGSQYAGAIFKKDGAMRQNADAAWKRYNEFADSEIDAAIEELAPQPKAAWRIAMLESIRTARAQETQPQGAPDVQPAQVDAASGQGAGAVSAGSAGNTPSGPVDLGRVDQPAGAPAPSSAARVPVGEPVVQQPAGVESVLDAVSPVAQPAAPQGVQPANVPPTQQVAPQAQTARGQEGAQIEQARDAERAQVSRIFDTLSEREREVLTKYHFDKMTFEEIGSELKERGESGTTRQRIEQQHKEALKKLAEAGRPFGLTPERLRLYFPDESRRMAGGADVQTASAAEVAQAGAGMTYRNESNNGAVNQANDEFEMADAVDGAEALDLDTDIAREEFDEGFRGERGADADVLEEVDAVESMVRTELDHKGIPLQPVDFEDAASDYDLMADEGDTPFAELPRQIQVQWVKAWVAAQDGALTEQQLVRVFSEIADQYAPEAQTVEPGAAATAQGVQENARGESESGAAVREEVASREGSGTQAQYLTEDRSEFRGTVDGLHGALTPVLNVTDPTEVPPRLRSDAGAWSDGESDGFYFAEPEDRSWFRGSKIRMPDFRYAYEVNVRFNRAFLLTPQTLERFVEQFGTDPMGAVRAMREQGFDGVVTRGFDTDWEAMGALVEQYGLEGGAMSWGPMLMDQAVSFDPAKNVRITGRDGKLTEAIRRVTTAESRLRLLANRAGIDLDAARVANARYNENVGTPNEEYYAGQPGAAEAIRFFTREDVTAAVAEVERANNAVLELAEQPRGEPRFSRTADTQGTTVEAVRSAINAIATPMGRRKITIVQSADELVERGVLNSSQARGTQGYVTRKGDAYFIADNIRPGNELAVVLHEIGAHLGIEKLLTDKQYESLVKKIFDWAGSDANTQESRIARAAIRRVAQANIENEADLSPETIAYFIEEAVKAGVNPTAMQYKTELGRWFRTLWAAFKVALRRLNLINADRLTAQNVVDLAYGAARIELASTYHGTAANFRRFDHRFMGSGEGAQAFGWGTYLAQRFGIANEYFEADVRRKGEDSSIRALQIDGVPVADYRATFDSGVDNDAEKTALTTLDVVSAFRIGWKTKDEIVQDAVEQLRHGMPWQTDYAAADWLENNADRISIKEASKPEGNIHIVDVNFTEDEMLDWFEPISKQSPQVRDAITPALLDVKWDTSRGFGGRLTTRAAIGEDGYLIEHGDGAARLYIGGSLSGEFSSLEAAKSAAVERASKEIGRVRGLDAYRALQDRLGSDKAASEYLDSLGIKGIKFLDAKSRGQKRDIVDKTGAPVPTPTRPTPGVRSALTFVAGFDSMAEALAEARKQAETYPSMSEMADVLAYWAGKGYQLKAADQTRNLVVFNDRNIYRVGSMRGGPVDKGGRMMFSKAADPQLTELAQESGQRALKAIQAGIRKGWTGLAFSSHLTDAAHRAGLTSARALELVQRKKATRAYEIQIEVEKVLSKFASLKGKIGNEDVGTVVQRFIYDSTFDKKWGFKPEWKNDAVVDPEMERRFQAIERANPEAANVVKEVFRHGDTIFREKQDLLRKTITGEYEALIKAETDDGKRRKLERQRDKELREAGRLIAELNGPYAPLRRYGNYVVVAKSQKYRDAEAAGPVDAKLKRDENHYVVEFAETLFEAEKLQSELESKFGKGAVWAGEKEASTQQFGELPFMAVQRLRKMVDTDLEGDLNTKSKRTLNKLLVDLYISTLHEANARHSEQKRQYVNRDRARAAGDMMRAFATQGRADSHLVSALQFNSEIVDEMQKLRNEAKNDQGDSKLKTRLRNEILQRHMMDLDFRETPVQDKLMSLNSFWMLLTSPGYYVQNATQVMMMTQPVLAGKFGQNRSMRQLMRGYQDAMRVLKGSSWNEAADLSRFNGTADEKAMLIELQARGTLDFGISAELGYWESRGEISKVFNQVMRKVGMGTRKLEVLNRMSSALAAYRMMYDQTTGTQAKRHAAALDYADSIIKDTHGDYSTTNAPRYLRMMPKVMTQFRKFQLIQLSLFAKVIHGSIKGANPQEKRAMRAALGYLFMNHALLAGAVGVPASALLGAVYAIAGDDDDPNDWEVDVRRAIGDKEMADLILHGLPSLININMSNKIGAGTMLDPLPFVEYEATRGGYEKAVTAAMGPLIGGLGAQVVDAFGRILKGDVAQGTAQLLPRGFRDAARGFMAAQDGIQLRNGQTALTPEELSFYDSLMMGLGLPTLKTTSRTETQFKTQQYETFFRERVTKLKRQYSEAYEKNDRQAMLEARQAWAEMQASRKNLGFKVQPLSELLKAPREKAKAEAKLQGGVRTTEQARGFVQSLQ